MKTFTRSGLVGLSLGIVASLATSLPAADWPQWRGPNRDGHSKETKLLREWPKEGPKLLWQTTNLGGGYSTPAVADGRIFLTANHGLTNEFALALSAKDGKPLWTAPLGKVGHPQQEPKYPGARSTPTVDGNFAAALGSDGDVVGLEAKTGKELWRKHLRNDFGGRHGQWAYAESLLVDGNRVICTPGGSNATMVALNRKTGAVIWTCRMPEGDDASYSSAVIAEFGGVKQYVQFLAKGLAGVEASTGKLLWRYERSAKGSPAVVITPIIAGDSVYSGAFRAGSALVKPVRKDGAFVVEELYFNNKLPFGIGNVVKVGNHLYGTGSQSLMCVDLNSAEIKWEERSPGVSLLAAHGLLFAHFTNGDVGLIEATPEGYRQKGRFTPPSRPGGRGDAAYALPVLADGRLYIFEQGSLWCFDVRAR
jgi:outer membrane protein assembly factor BamB